MNNDQHREKVIDAIHRAIDQVNQLRPEGFKLPKTLDTVLLGESGTLDSLGFVNLVVAAEEQLEQSLGRPIVLTDEEALTAPTGPFRTVGSLVDHVLSILATDR